MKQMYFFLKSLDLIIIQSHSLQAFQTFIILLQSHWVSRNSELFNFNLLKSTFSTYKANEQLLAILNTIHLKKQNSKVTTITTT